jgi:hypothetical protein
VEGQPRPSAWEGFLPQHALPPPLIATIDIAARPVYHHFTMGVQFHALWPADAPVTKRDEYLKSGSKDQA